MPNKQKENIDQDGLLTLDEGWSFDNFTELLYHRCREHPERTALNFLVDGELEQQLSLTYQEMDEQIRAVAAHLQQFFPAHSRVLIMCPAGNEFVLAFLACFYARMTAVPCVLPNRRESDWVKTYGIVDDCQASAIITTGKYYKAYQEKFSGKDCKVIRLESVNSQLSDKFIKPDFKAEDIAFLQYTSGSTGSSKGVMVSQRNLMHNQRIIQTVFKNNSSTRHVSWLPLFHDLGLIGCALQSLYLGITYNHMSPIAFMQQPLRWLRAIDHFKATTSGAPNFAYELCADRATEEQLRNLDLSSWQCAFNAAEPVRAGTIEKFNQVFSPCGLSQTAHFPFYGLAEGTLIVSGAVHVAEPVYHYIDSKQCELGYVQELPRDVPGGQLHVSVGPIVGDQILRIVNPESKQQCKQQEIGEIWVKGPSVAEGYWQKPEKTLEDFQAYIKDSKEGPFLRTGDVGFTDENGELYISGRIKDMIIIRGLNHYPQDIEFTVQQSHDALRPDWGAAFSITENDEEKLVVVHEIKRTQVKKVNPPEVIASIRRAVSEQHDLQTYAVVLVAPGSIFKTSSGKIQRNACRQGFIGGTLRVIGEWRMSDNTTADGMVKELNASIDIESMQSWLINQFSASLHIPAKEIDIDSPFSFYGLDSAAAVDMAGRIGDKLERKLSATLIYNYPNIRSLASYLAGLENINQDLLVSQNAVSNQGIAVVGMGCRFPKAENIGAFWQILENGYDAVTTQTSEQSRSHIRTGGFLDDVSMFDASFFGISPHEADAMDPQQRLVLEVTWQAFENAGIVPEHLSGSMTGVFLGISHSYYALQSLNSPAALGPYLGTGCAQSIAANRLSYLLDLRGPSWVVDTACSSSLVALHQACRSLKNNECNMAITGGVNLLLAEEFSSVLDQAEMLSADGRCKTFDAGANGYVRGEGCGVVILKRVQDAIDDGDNILGVIAGSAVNQDGRSNGLTAPNGLAQQTVVKQALQDAGVSAKQVSYVEAHGTGTPLGDPIEVNSLKEVLMQERSKDEVCYIGSVKTNIGHLEAAAGIAGLIKVILSLQHKKIPGNLHFNHLNPEIDIVGSPLLIAQKTEDWASSVAPRTAGLSSFGFGGTNSHAILQEHVNKHASGNAKQKDKQILPQILLVSAKNDAALRQVVESYQNYFSEQISANLQDVCFTTRNGRTHFKHRLALVASDTTAFSSLCSHYLSGRKLPGLLKPHEPIKGKSNIVFLFTGQGSQYLGMGSFLYKTEPVFKQAIDRCQELLTPLLDQALRDFICPTSETDNDLLTALLDRTDYTQPILFSFEYALAQLWLSWGVRPSAVFGHSLGEYVAACIAGVFTLGDGLRLVVERGKLIHSLPSNGKMVVVFADEKTVLPMLDTEKVNIAAINGPNNTVLSGEQRHIDAMTEKLDSVSLRWTSLKVSQAFHSYLLEPVLERFKSVAASIKFSSPRFPVISGVSGEALPDAEIMSPSYWCRQTREAVNFNRAIKTLCSVQGNNIFVEVGPNPILTAMGKQCLSTEQTANGDVWWLPSLSQGEKDQSQILDSLACLYMLNIDIDWRMFDKSRSYTKTMLPNYPFQRRRHWLQSEQKQNAIPAEIKEMLLAKKHVNRNQVNVGATGTMSNSYSRENVSMRVANILIQNISELSGIEGNEIEVQTNLFRIGLDSLILMRLRQIIQKEFDIDIEMSRFHSEVDTIEKLASYICENSSFIDENQAVGPSHSDLAMDAEGNSSGNAATVLPASLDYSGGNALERVMQMQLNSMKDLMAQQLKVFEGGPKESNVPVLQNKQEATIKKNAASKELDKQHFAQIKSKINVTHPISGMNGTAVDGLSDKHYEFIKEFVARYTEKTRGSKEFATEYRPIFSDWINTIGFRPLLKELMYPVVAERSKGSKIWDVNGNEYIDIAMGYGVGYLGHNPPFVMDALKEQMQKGLHLGPQCDLAGKVAQLICELAGVERVAFSNTGTESVMVALRVARSVTGRKKVVMFEHSYHGLYDGTLGIPANGETLPGFSGILQSSVDDVIILKYNDPKALDIIASLQDELAAVLVEPVQTRVLDFPAKEFLQKLRGITQSAGIALILDEIVTGFRLGLGGAQKYFDIEADIVLFGKMVGGGMPIGVISGKADFIDAIDGGEWKFGDNSIPVKDRTFFAGTFCKHPLTMAAALATLTFLKDQGGRLQDEVNTRTRRFVETMNGYFAEENIWIRIKHAGPTFRFCPQKSSNPQLQEVCMELLFYLMMEKGIYTWEKRLCNFSIAHTDEDIEKLISAVKESISELRKHGFAFTDNPWETGNNVHTSSGLVKNNVFPLSSVQKRLHVIDGLENGNMLFHIVAALKMQGRLDVAKLEDCIQQIVERHEILRSAFSLLNNELSQTVHDNMNINIAHKKISYDRLDDFLHSVMQPFDLTTAPLFRVYLIQTDTNEHMMVWHIHHIIFDGFSCNVMLTELLQLYAGKELPPVSAQYRDYVLWEKGYIHSQQFMDDEAFWLEKLKDNIPQLNLPTDYPRPPRQDFSGEHVYWEIGSEKTKELKALAGEMGTSLFMLLFSAYCVLLHKLTGQEKMVVGVTNAGRGLEEFNDTLGMFVNMLVMSPQPFADMRFSHFLRNVSEDVMTGFDHQNYPFENLVEKLKLSRDVSHGAIFDTAFSYEDGTQRLLNDGTLNISEYYFKPEVSILDFGLEVAALGEKTCFWFGFCTALFSQETIERYKDYYGNILQAIISQPDIQLSEIDYIPGAEKQKILWDWNATEADYPADKCIHELFEEQVIKNPDDIALVIKGEELSYKQLNIRANKVAHYLISQGTKPNDLVGLYMERSFDMIVAMLGILKAGGAYLPVATDNPSTRINFMLDDANVNTILSQSSLAHSISTEKRTVIYLDTDSDSKKQKHIFANQSSENISRKSLELNSRNLAYVNYTSGSTGHPKGVMVEHKSVNRLLFNCGYLPFEEGLSILHISPVAFDAAVFEIWGSLLHGGKCVLYPESKFDLGEFEAVVTSNKLDASWLTSSLFNIISDIKPELLQLIKYVLTGGEALSVKHLVNVYDKCKDTQIINGYGPTEGTTFTSCYHIPKELDTTQSSVPIGRPINNTTAYVLDAQQQPVPIGVVGELYIGGAGLARGYLNQPELTQEKFISHPFSDAPDARLYKSGDLVRWLEDGRLEFVGRIDNQVKVRGFRIELGEIEICLSRHSAVRHAVVSVHEVSPGDKRLVAYIVPQQKVTSEAISALLRPALQEKLPDYMLPNAFVVLDNLPLLANGKVNRKALPAPYAENVTASQYVAPSTETEKALAGIWAKLLNMDLAQISTESNFFTMGGHSLLATHLVSEIHERFSTAITIRTVFDEPTIKQLADHIADSERFLKMAALQEKIRSSENVLEIEI